MQRKKYLKKSILVIVISFIGISYAKSQTSTVGHFVPGLPAINWCGWNAATPIPFNLEHRGTQNINFLTGGVQRMTILGTSAGANAGFVGIGTPAPTQKFEVETGNIHVFTPTNAYMLGGQNILWHKGEIRNLFVGVNAGTNTAGANAFQNTFIGSSAGFANTTGQRNTFVGANAGESVVQSNFNTFIGTDAGKMFVIGNHNTFVGEQAGERQLSGTNNCYFGAHASQGSPPAPGTGIGSDNTILGAFAGADFTNGNGNTFTGNSAGRNCTDGSRNVMSGSGSGFGTTTGDLNVFSGFGSGQFNVTGSANVFLGANSGAPNTTFSALNNAIAIGFVARVRDNNKMILGNNQVFVGIGLSDDNVLNGPQNKLEIDAGINGFNPSPPATIGASGLRFRDLHSGNSPVANGSNGVDNTKVLTVDQNGDVVLTSVAASAGVLGNYCSNPTNPLTGNYNIPLNGNRFSFEGPGTVNVGNFVSCANINVATLYVRSSGAEVTTNTAFRADYNPVSSTAAGNAIYGAAATVPNRYAGYFSGNINVTGTPFASVPFFNTSDKRIKENITTIDNPLAVIGKLNPVSFNFNTSYAPQVQPGSGNNYGFIAQEVADQLPELVRDVVVQATYDSLGNQIDSAVTLKSLNYTGLIPFAIGGIQQLNSRQQQMQQALDRAGLSDADVKTNVSSFNALSKIKQLSPVSYTFTNANVPQLSFGSATDYGFVAQQLYNVYPELIDSITVEETTDSLGNLENPAKVLKTINYKAMSALLTRAVQEQQVTIDSLKHAQDSINTTVQNQLSQLTSLINSCCQNQGARTQAPNTMDVELSDKDVIVLNQNVPNPFAEQTSISYYIPEKSGFAQIIFNDMKGQIIKVVDIKTKGKGQLNVFANDLSTGMYSYSLFVDGKLADTKKMLKTE